MALLAGLIELNSVGRPELSPLEFEPYNDLPGCFDKADRQLVIGQEEEGAVGEVMGLKYDYPEGDDAVDPEPFISSVKEHASVEEGGQHSQKTFDYRGRRQLLVVINVAEPFEIADGDTVFLSPEARALNLEIIISSNRQN